MNKKYFEYEVYLNKKINRNFIIINNEHIRYAHYVAKNNPDICGEWFEGCEVHHINGNSADDRPENLIILTSEEHHRIHSKPIDAYYGNKYLGRFSSMTNASKELNIPVSTISHYCKHQKPISTTYSKWRFNNLTT